MQDFVHQPYLSNPPTHVLFPPWPVHRTLVIIHIGSLHPTP